MWPKTRGHSSTKAARAPAACALHSLGGSGFDSLASEILRGSELSSFRLGAEHYRTGPAAGRNR